MRKLFTPANHAIARVCGYYVDTGKNKKIELEKVFLSLPEEEVFKYFTIFRDALSDTMGKNLINMELPLHAEAEGGTHHFLMKSWDGQLKDDGTSEEFCSKVAANYDYGENCYIILIHCTCDIPAKAMDEMGTFDASEHVYEFVQCAICPAKLTKAGLSRNPLTDAIENRNRDRLAEASNQGFLFPAFNDGNTDVHSLLYYSRDPKQMPKILIDELLGYIIPTLAKSQEGTFQAIMEETLGEDCGFGTVRTIHEDLAELVEETKGEPVSLALGKYQMKKFLETNGATPERLEEFEQQYAQVGDGSETSFVAADTVNIRSFEIKTPDASTRVTPSETYLVENRMTEGQPCIVVVINEHMEVNGISVRPVGVKRPEEE